MATQKIKEETAYHEAGHAVAYILTNRKFKYVTINPDKKNGSLGHLEGLRQRPLDSMTVERSLNAAVRSLSGVTAEAIHTGRTNHIGASSDYGNTCNLILSVFGQDGPTVQLFLKFIKSHTAELLQANWPYIERVTAALLECETLRYDEVRKLRIPELLAAHKSGS